jgi:hypothetical protein
MIQDIESIDGTDSTGTTVVGGTTGGTGTSNTSGGTSETSNQLTVSDSQVRSAFSYTPSTIEVNYMQHYGDAYIEVPITVTNASKTFALRIYPNIANENIKIYASGSTNDSQPLSSTSAFILQANSTKDLILRETTKVASTTGDGYTELREIGVYSQNLNFVVTAVTLPKTK